MKQLKLTVLAFFLLAAVGTSVQAQDSNNPWGISFGVNWLDAMNATGGVGEEIKDFLGTGDWGRSFVNVLSRASGEKYLSDGFSFRLIIGQCFDQFFSFTSNGNSLQNCQMIQQGLCIYSRIYSKFLR